MTSPKYGSTNLSATPNSDGLVHWADQSRSSPTPYREHLLINIPMGGAQPSTPEEKLPDAEKLLWTIDETASQLSVHPRTVARLIEKGKLPVVRIGRAVRIEKKSVCQFIDQERRYNERCAGSAVQGESTCPISAKTVCSGGRRSPTQTARELDALLEPPTTKKQKP